MVHQVIMPATKPSDLSSVPRIHTLSLSCVCIHAYIHTNSYIFHLLANFNFKFFKRSFEANLKSRLRRGERTPGPFFQSSLPFSLREDLCTRPK